MSGKIYGYIRVSSRDQNEDRQCIAMREFGVSDSCIFVDKQSGKDFERPGYRHLMKKIKPGDTLVIKSMTGWAAIMRKFWLNGGSSQKRSRPLLWFLICRYSIPDKGGISQVR